jgi:hypothetical protein
MLNAPQSGGVSRAQSLVSWTRSWEITESIAGPGGAQPPECNWDGKETGHVAQGIHAGIVNILGTCGILVLFICRRVGRQERVRKNSPVIKPASNNQ